MTTTNVLAPKVFDVPVLAPSPNGLYAATDWQEDAEERWRHGVQFRPSGNYGGNGSFGLWEAQGCGESFYTVDLPADAASGTWTMTVDGQTATIAFADDGAAATTKLEALPNLDAGDVVVIGAAHGPYRFDFLRRVRTVTVNGANLKKADNSPSLGLELTADLKNGTRPDAPAPFYPVTVWAYDECDLTAPSRDEVKARALQILKIEEQTALEEEFSRRMLFDAAQLDGGIETATSLKQAVGYLEGIAAQTNTLLYFHVGAQWASQEWGLFLGSGVVKKTPNGHTWIIGGGYVQGLEDSIVVTSKPYGWRDEAVARTAMDQYHNTFAAVAERTVLIGYEAVIGAVTITP